MKSDCFESNEKLNLAADLVAEFCERTLNACLGGNSSTVSISSVQAGQTTILHVLGLLKDTICSFSKLYVKVGFIHKLFIKY